MCTMPCAGLGMNATHGCYGPLPYGDSENGFKAAAHGGRCNAHEASRRPPIAAVCFAALGLALTGCVPIPPRRQGARDGTDRRRLPGVPADERVEHPGRHQAGA